MTTEERATTPGGPEVARRSVSGEADTSIIPETPFACNPLFNADTIPDELTTDEVVRWVAWREEDVGRDKPQKVPYIAATRKRADSTDPAGWTTFADCIRYINASRNWFSGLGFVLGGGWAGVDLDNCISEAGELHPAAAEIVDWLASYTEVSPSGRGLKVFLRADLGDREGHKKKGQPWGGDVEVYWGARYFTMTGRHWPGTPATVEDRQAELEALHGKLWPVREAQATPPPAAGNADDDARLAAAFRAKNGARIRSLFDAAGQDGNSETDAELCGLVAFYSSGDPATLERLVRRSNRVRPKWDTARGAETWIGRECRLAVEKCADFWTPSGRKNKNAGPGDGDDQGDDDDGPVADQLVRIALEEVTLFRDGDGTRYAEAPVGDRRETYDLPERGGNLRDWLVRRYRKETAGKTPHAAALAQALVAVRAEAAIAPTRAVALRTTEADGAIWLDLCNDAREVVKITPDGWTVTRDVSDSFVFKRPPAMRPLPYPVQGGAGLVELRGLVNVLEEGDFLLLVATMLAALRPGYPYPVLTLIGEAGTAKSTTAKMYRYTLDPQGDGSEALTVMPETPRDLFAIAGSCHVVALDNTSGMSEQMSNAISALATGAGYMGRKYYTDDDLHITTARRPVCINGIGSSGADLCGRADLLDRAIVVNLAPVPDDRRIKERDLWPEFRRLAPAILGDLLDATVTAMKRLDTFDIPSLPRMADLADWVTAAEPSLPWGEGEFLRTYGANRQGAVEALLESDPIAMHLVDLAQCAETPWTGTPAALLSALDDCVGDADRRRKDWPGNVKALGRRLTLITPALRKMGVEVERVRQTGGSRSRLIVLRMSEGGESSAGQDVQKVGQDATPS